MNVSDNFGTTEMQEEMEKLKKSMHKEKMLKVQAINKLTEIVHRKDNLTRKDIEAESKASSDKLRKREGKQKTPIGVEHRKGEIQSDGFQNSKRLARSSGNFLSNYLIYCNV